MKIVGIGKMKIGSIKRVREIRSLIDALSVGDAIVERENYI